MRWFRDRILTQRFGGHQTQKQPLAQKKNNRGNARTPTRVLNQQDPHQSGAARRCSVNHVQCTHTNSASVRVLTLAPAEEHQNAVSVAEKHHRTSNLQIMAVGTQEGSSKESSAMNCGMYGKIRSQHHHPARGRDCMDVKI